jgi:hypothetical protein
MLHSCGNGTAQRTKDRTVSSDSAQMASQGYTYTRRRQSLKTHLWLLLLTGGIGNIVYVLWAKSKAAARYEW